MSPTTRALAGVAMAGLLLGIWSILAPGISSFSIPSVSAPSSSETTLGGEDRTGDEIRLAGVPWIGGDDRHPARVATTHPRPETVPPGNVIRPA